MPRFFFFFLLSRPPGSTLFPYTTLFRSRGRFKNRARLHLGNFREGNPESTAAMPEHRIELVQLVYTPRNLLSGDAEFICQLILLGVIVRQKFVKRRIEKPDRGGQSFQLSENSDEVFSLIRK